MSDDDTTRLWLVGRSYDNRGLIILIYAAPDGEYELRRELTTAMIHQRRVIVTTTIDVPTESLEPVDGDDLCERYATEATKIAGSREPDGEV